ncbi:MAG TPA: hypothetical protein DCK93_13985 [Blastocatellia bacterium]|jgi:hypothetical protein|nr:hypothetical protein [Blastocatellia bacterium]
MRKTVAISTETIVEAQSEQPVLKDTVLTRLAEVANVAQFVSFGPDLKQRYAKIRKYDVDHSFGSVGAAAAALLKSAGSVNVRSFEPNNAKSREFIYGLTTEQQVTSEVGRLASLGLFTIINETIDINDGGVSGVALGNLVEFAPGDTPRCVEKPGTVSLPEKIAFDLLEKVYGFPPDLSRYSTSERVEFSLHPIRRGVKHDHTIVWELEEVGGFETRAEIFWPNRFSRFIGDKAFGLLLADALGLPIPATKVFARSLPPFTFGKTTGSGETWIRTCPVEQDPGRYTTHRGWLDPFELLAREDPDGTKIASVLAQEGVNAEYSGSLIVEQEGEVKVEGVPGYGDDFMLGRTIGLLPKPVKESVFDLYREAAEQLGPVRLEWVHDGEKPWIVQLHKGATASLGNTIYPGEALVFHRFDVQEGIESLRELIRRVRNVDEGVIIVGEVGITSHLGDLLRKAKIPSRIEL